jgi:hypothetical protein
MLCGHFVYFSRFWEMLSQEKSGNPAVIDRSLMSRRQETVVQSCNSFCHRFPLNGQTERKKD